VVAVLVIGGFLAGCANSSSSVGSSFTPTGGGAGDGPSSGYSSGDGSSVQGTTFAPTPAAEHSAAQAADKLTAVARVGDSSYRIGPLDVLDVSVYQVADLQKTVQVGDDGSINYPLVGDVPAVGKTARELERDLQARLGAKYLRSPQVTVYIKESNSQRVTIEGSVKQSGVFPLKGRTTLVQVMAMAGGVNMDTDSGDVVIFRTVNGVKSAAKFDIDAIKAGKADDPELRPGDVIVVDTSNTKLALSNVMKVLPLATTAAIFSGL
jgi:polysaccharide biosynthesis/export protein